MTADLTLQKREMRHHLRAAMKAISVEDRSHLSQLACARLREQRIWQNAQCVLLFASLPDELDVQPLIGEALANGKRVALPRFNFKTCAYEAVEINDLTQDCASGKFGILEPSARCSYITPNHLDLLIVPGVGFDARGYRLGRGKGYYDRLLAGVTGVKCGIAFDQQIVQTIPSEAHDVRMDFILSPSRWMETGQTTCNKLK